MSKFSAIAPVQVSAPSIQLPNGSYTARLVKIIDLGSHLNTKYPDKGTQRSFTFTFETPTKKEVFKKDGQKEPFLISQDVNFVFSKPDAEPTKISTLSKIRKAINKDLENANIFDLLNGVLTIQTELNDKGYAKIINFIQLSEDIDPSDKKFAQINPFVEFYIDHFEQEVFDTFPEFIKNKIIDSPEFRQKMLELSGIPSLEKIQAQEDEAIDIIMDDIKEINMDAINLNYQKKS